MLDSSHLNEFADNYFKFDENGRWVSKRVENTVRKGEIARYEQFLLFPLCFQKMYCRHVKTRDCLGKGYGNNGFYFIKNMVLIKNCILISG